MEKERKPVGGSAAVLVRRGGICPRRQETGKEEKRKGETEKGTADRTDSTGFLIKMTEQEGGAKAGL